MSNPEVAILMLCLFIVLVLLGFPIAFTLIAMGVGFGYYAYYSSPQTFSDIFDNQIFYLLNQNTYSVMESDTLVAIPLFLFMGYVVERADIVGRLFRSLQMAAHNLPGSMAISALVTCAVFSTASGIVGAVVTLMGLLAYPAMAKANYDKKFAAGVICAGGTLGILIPPSIMLIVYAAIAELSPLRLYAAAMFPGLLLAGLYIVYAITRATLNPSIAPKPPAEDIPPTAEIYRDLLVSFLPLTVLIVTVLGSILGGLATPAEAAAMGALGSMILAALYRALTWQKNSGKCVPVCQSNRHGLLVIRWFLDVRVDLLVSWWTRCDRALGARNEFGSLAIPHHGSSHHLRLGLASRVVGNSDHLRPDLFADARHVRSESLFLCDVGRTQSSDLLPDTADGDVCLLPERGLEKSD